ncbi:PREDICTED: uncharacterized protein LOC105455336 [Wasmannia auropunctata]|uniref:uncharacterized protein LOC105455336 n=1 Tax=Wasmannia auropunctata TaxID=64793 RepID=UPI0005EDFB52|nr:PREDICTED: uncharacterized protein LOC105455336 [Wasmannia auropunctata]
MAGLMTSDCFDLLVVIPRESELVRIPIWILIFRTIFGSSRDAIVKCKYRECVKRHRVLKDIQVDIFKKDISRRASRSIMESDAVIGLIKRGKGCSSKKGETTACIAKNLADRD